MKKTWMIHAISTVSFLVFIALGMASASSPKPAEYYDPAQTKGLGVIVVDAEYITYRNVTRTRERIEGGEGMATGGGPWGRAIIPDDTSHIVTETYTTREPVKDDYKLPFIILENGIEIFNGVTPVRVRNFDPSVLYTIIWIGANGNRKEGTFVISNTRPFTRNIHIE